MHECKIVHFLHIIVTTMNCWILMLKLVLNFYEKKIFSLNQMERDWEARKKDG